MSTLLLMTVHHKKDAFLDISKKYFTPIQVGKAITDLDLDIKSDMDEPDNISIKNKTFCELTAYYLAWKNDNYDYIGLMHYRRIFTEKVFLKCSFKNKLWYILKIIHNLINFRYVQLSYGGIVKKVKDKQEAEKLSKSFYEYIMKNLDNYDIFLPKKVRFRYLNMEQQYIINHNIDDWLMLKKIITTKFPYLQEFMELSIKSKDFYIYNMFIARKNIFDDYMNVLFSILFELEKIISTSNKSEYQARVFGFLAERFFNIYLNYLVNTREIKIKELNTIFIDL